MIKLKYHEEEPFNSLNSINRFINSLKNFDMAKSITNGEIIDCIYNTLKEFKFKD